MKFIQYRYELFILTLALLSLLMVPSLALGQEFQQFSLGYERQPPPDDKKPDGQKPPEKKRRGGGLAPIWDSVADLAINAKEIRPPRSLGFPKLKLKPKHP